MNIHVPQSLAAHAELKMISSAPNNIISAQSSKPNVAIVQDSLLGSYRMTLTDKKLTRSQFFDISMKIGLSSSQTLEKIDHIKSIFRQKGKKHMHVFSGKGIFSLFLPITLNYEKKNNANALEPVVKIYRGVMYEGTLDKTILGSAHNSLIQVMNKEYGKEAASHFIDCVQFASNNWLLVSGFSIGLGDCFVQESGEGGRASKEQEIRDVVLKCFMEADNIKLTTSHPGIREMRVNATLNKAKDVGLRIAKEALASDNNFLSTVNSGSKGDFVNIAQICGLLGQQNLKGNRVPLTMNNGTRSLPHYPKGELTPELEYESRGFIASSFLGGLNPREFYFHAMSGREGMCDTAMGKLIAQVMPKALLVIIMVFC